MFKAEDAKAALNGAMSEFFLDSEIWPQEFWNPACKSMNDNRTKKQAEEWDEKGWTTELQKKDKVEGRDEVNGKDTDKRTGRRTSKLDSINDAKID